MAEELTVPAEPAEHQQPAVPEIVQARERLAALPETPVHEHPALFDEVQRLLTAALDPDAQGAPARAAGAR